MPLRYDNYRIANKAIKLDNGFLKVPVAATRVGVFSYARPDGTIRRELRHPDEVFKADSLNTLRGVPLTNRHPSELVNSKNVRKYMVGSVSDLVERKDEFVMTSATVMDEKAIAEIELKGIREVSCGYKCDVEESPGEYEGEHYDAIQTKIKYNHLAIVKRGRAGPNVKLHLDSEDAELVEDGVADPDFLDNHKGGNRMFVIIDGVKFDVDDSVASAITQALTKRDNDLAAVNTELETIKTDSKKELDGLQAKHDQLAEDHEKIKKDAAEAPKVSELVKARVALVESAKPHVDEETLKKFDDMDDKEIKLAVIAAKVDKFDSEGKSDDYINARFDAILEKAPEKKTTKLDGALKDVSDNRGNEDKTPDDIRKDAMEYSQNAWQLPLDGRAVEGSK